MSSSLSAKYSIEIEAKSPARAMYEACAKRMYEIPKLCPTYIPKVDLVEGNWEDVGAVVKWHLVYGGKLYIISKEIIESKDDEKLSVTFNLIEGELVEAYKGFKVIFLAIPKKEGCLSRWSVEYEKLNADIPHPIELLPFSAGLTREIDDTLMKISQE